MPGPVKLFVGCAPDAADAESCCVLEHSLRKRSSLPVEIIWMIASHSGYWSGWDKSRWATPFSAFRWSLPAYCGYQGRALYTDSDVIFLADVAELWETEIALGKVAVARADIYQRFCVALFDCAAARPHMLSLVDLKRADGHDRQTAYFRRNRDLVQQFDGAWNYLDLDTGPLAEAKIVHYTSMDMQPHLKYAIPRLAAEGRRHWYDGPARSPRKDVVDLFEREFAEAQAVGYTPDRYVPQETFGELGKRSMVGYRARRG